MSVKVLLVDDEQQFVEILAERLEARGLAVTTAFNGDDGLARLKEQTIDVVVLDVAMPGKDGVATLRDMKQLKPLVEIIMLTGHATVETAIEGMKLGAYNYLLKPTETEDLVDKITKASRRKMEQEERIRQAELDRIVKSRGW